MRRLAWLGLVALAGLGSVACSDSEDDNKEVFAANLSGAEEVPARSTAASGSATIIVDGDQVTYAIEVDDITAVTAAHIHSGAPGTNGSIRLFLYPPQQGQTVPQVTTTERMILVTATVPASNVTGIAYQELLNEMRSGGAYVNVHTVQFPGGEIRGTIRPQ